MGIAIATASRWLAFRATAVVPVLFGLASVQQPTSPTAASAMGTYALGTTRPVSSNGSGCWLEAAPVRTDSMRLQILCRKPAPGHHLGVLDARLPLEGTTLVYERRNASSERCRITVRFAKSRATVAQEGSDSACGFGAFVNVSGTYTRLSKQQPPFDIAPIERAASHVTKPNVSRNPSR